MPQDQWVWKILELEASAATQKLNSRPPSSFLRKKNTCLFQEVLGVPKESDLFICTAAKSFRGKLEMCLVLDKNSKNLQSKWMGQMHSSFTNVKLKPQIALKAHDRARHSIYIPEPDLMPYLQISLSFNCVKLLYNLPHLQRLLKLTTESKNWHSLKHEVGEAAMQSRAQCRFLQPNFCWSSPVQEFLLTSTSGGLQPAKED